MGKAGRFACIFTPMAMTIASLICLVIVLSGQAYQKSELSRSLYFFKVCSTIASPSLAPKSRAAASFSPQDRSC